MAPKFWMRAALVVAVLPLGLALARDDDRTAAEMKYPLPNGKPYQVVKTWDDDINNKKDTVVADFDKQEDANKGRDDLNAGRPSGAPYYYRAPPPRLDFSAGPPVAPLTPGKDPPPFKLRPTPKPTPAATPVPAPAPSPKPEAKPIDWLVMVERKLPNDPTGAKVGVEYKGSITVENFDSTAEHTGELTWSAEGPGKISPEKAMVTVPAGGKKTVEFTVTLTAADALFLYNPKLRQVK